MNVHRASRRVGKPSPVGTMQAVQEFPEMHTDTVLHVNFGLSWQKIAALFAGAGTLITAGITAGWLVLPASKTELTTVANELAQTRGQVIELQMAVKSLTEAVGELRAAVQQTAATAARTNEAVTRRLPANPRR